MTKTKRRLLEDKALEAAVGLRDQIKRLERATQEERNVEALKNTFMAAVKQLRAQADGGAPPPGTGVQHRIVDVEDAKREIIGEVEDLSEPRTGFTPP